MGSTDVFMKPQDRPRCCDYQQKAFSLADITEGKKSGIPTFALRQQHAHWLTAAGPGVLDDLVLMWHLPWLLHLLEATAGLAERPASRSRSSEAHLSLAHFLWLRCSAEVPISGSAAAVALPASVLSPTAPECTRWQALRSTEHRAHHYITSGGCT